MKLRNPLTVITSTLFLVFAAGCSSPLVYTSVWQDKPVVIDGRAKEWKIPLDFYDDKTKLNFTVTNDSKNLYFCVRATENETQKGIVHEGLQIWIDTTGGTKSQVGIQFPILERDANSSGSSSTGHSKPSQSMDEVSEAAKLKSFYMGTSKQVKLTGFTNAPNGLAQVPNMDGINVCLNWDTNNIMIYEACIPLNTFFKANLSKADSNKVLGIAFIVKITPSNVGGGGHEMRAGDMAGETGGMGGSMGGASSHGHSRGHSDGGSSSSTESLTAHIKLRLAPTSPPKQY